MLYYSKSKEATKEYDKRVRVFMWKIKEGKYAFLVTRTNTNDLRNLVKNSLRYGGYTGFNYDNSKDITDFVRHKALLMKPELELDKVNLRDCYRNICKILVTEGTELVPLNNSKVLIREFEEIKDSYMIYGK
jgi:hypothetical protein